MTAIVTTVPLAASDYCHHIRPDIAPTIHLLKIIRGFQHDGPGMLALNLLQAWQPHQIRVSVLALDDAGPLRQPIEAETRRLGGCVYSLPSLWRNWLECTNYLVCLAHFIGATHLHSHLIRADVIARKAAKRLGLPYWVTEHGLHGWSEKGRLLRPVVRAWYLRAGPADMKICAVSRKVRRDLLAEGVPPQNIRLVENGINLDLFQPVTDRHKQALRNELSIPKHAFPVIAVLGSLTSRKSPHTALSAIRVLADDPVLDPYVLYMGEGPDHDRLHRQVERLGLRSRVQFCLQIANPARRLNASDLLLHPAREEPFGLAVAEAQASGLPVIARMRSGADELLWAGLARYCVDGDDPQVWARQIRQAVSDIGDEQRAHIRQHACDRFAIERAAQAYLQLYRAAVVVAP